MPDKIVDHGLGPRIFGSKIISINTGPGVFSFTVAVSEYRGDRITAKPDEGNEVFAVTGYITLTDFAVDELITAIARARGGAGGQEVKRPAAH